LQIDSDVVKDAYVWCENYLQSLLDIEESIEPQLTTTCLAEIVSFCFFFFLMHEQDSCNIFIICREVKNSSTIRVVPLLLLGEHVVFQDPRT